MQNIQDNYAEEVEKLFYEEYAQLVLLLRKSHEEFGGYTGVEYYTIMDGKSSKWFEKNQISTKSYHTIAQF